MESVATWRRFDSAISNSVFETKVEVKMFEIRPTDSVTAKPRIGPVPNWKRKAAEMRAEMCVSTQRQEDAAEPGIDGRADAAFGRRAPL